MQVGHQLCRLFTTLLLFYESSQPAGLWTEFHKKICDDLKYCLQHLGFQNPSQEDIYNYSLHIVKSLLQENEHTLDQWPSMPRPVINWNSRIVNLLIAEQLDYEPSAETQLANTNIQLFNDDQKLTFDTIISSVNSDTSRLFFLHGLAGTGKMFIYNTICNQIQGQSLVVLCVASSGISAPSYHWWQNR
ncbi:PIF1-like helicase-domain-containing protein [Lactarius quietus]|nr:PIF1-like helicase-domain-containing protein [Lactarius quietus]